MPDIKRYKVQHHWNADCEVTLEVDHEILTRERAKEINDFWGDAEYRFRHAKSDVFAVITLFGQRLIHMMMAEGGSEFGLGHEAADIWSKQLRAEEGWGGEPDPAFSSVSEILHGWCGIRVVAANVEIPSFSDFMLKAIKI